MPRQRRGDGGVSVAIVDRLEGIEIDKQQSGPGAVALASTLELALETGGD